MHLNIIKAIYDKLLTNFILSREKIKAFPVTSGIRQECPLSVYLFNIVLEILACKVRQEK